MDLENIEEKTRQNFIRQAKEFNNLEIACQEADLYIRELFDEGYKLSLEEIEIIGCNYIKDNYPHVYNKFVNEETKKKVLEYYGTEE